MALYFRVRIGALGNAVRASSPRQLGPKNKRNFLTIKFSVEGCGEGPTEKGKDISLFWDRRFVLQKSSVSVSIYLRVFHFTFLRTRGVRGALAYTERVVILAFAHYTPAPPHSSLTPFALAAAVPSCVSLVISFEFVVFKKRNRPARCRPADLVRTVLSSVD